VPNDLVVLATFISVIPAEPESQAGSEQTTVGSDSRFAKRSTFPRAAGYCRLTCKDKSQSNTPSRLEFDADLRTSNLARELALSPRSEAKVVAVLQ
jgi:hypothetical protein